jgi:BON domain
MADGNPAPMLQSVKDGSLSLTMGRLSLVIGLIAAIANSAGCVSTATQERKSGTSTPVKSVTNASPTILVPQTPADLGIRRDLHLAISHDAELRSRDISYIVANGDVSVTGIVRTEEERRRINDLAMNIGEVKSVANALRVEE